MPWNLVAASAAVVVCCVFGLWLVSVRLRDVSIVDIWWGPGFAVIAWVSVAMLSSPAAEAAPPSASRSVLVACVLTAWGGRLGSYLARRNLGHGEDRRYQAMRGDSRHFWWIALFKVFLLQAGIQLLVSLPVFFAISSAQPMSALDVVGLVIALSGVVVEAVADHQLAAFKADGSNDGAVMDKGLWGYSRHPNYFGNAVLWCGVGLVGIASGAPAWSLAGPLLMIFLLLKVSGVSLLESTITERRPAYRQYIDEVSAFVPWPRKR